MKIPVLVIAQVLGPRLPDALRGDGRRPGAAFTGAGCVYPFFAAYLGWLGVFLTGSDTASNALFGSLQRITAQQLDLNPNPDRGDQLDRRRDGQDDRRAIDHGRLRRLLRGPKERSHALGPDLPHGLLALDRRAAVIGVIAMLQAYVSRA